jgi:hypothetical protein
MKMRRGPVQDRGIGETTRLRTRTAVSSAIAGVVLACRLGSPAPAAPPAAIDVAHMSAESALVVIRQDRLDAVFPVGPLPREGCTTFREHAYVLHWNVGYETPPVARRIAAALDTTNASRTRAQLDSLHRLLSTPSVRVSIPLTVDFSNTTPISREMVDTAFGRRALWVETARVFRDGGDRAIGPDALAEAERRAIYFDHGHLHLAIQGRAAVDAFGKDNPDSVTLAWCAANGRDTTVIVPLQRPRSQ